LTGGFITAHARAPLLYDNEYPPCRFIVDASIQDRRRPARLYHNVKPYFSGKNKCDCLKCQVITNRDGMPVHIVAEVPRAMHDLRLFRENLSGVEELVANHSGEPTDILARKGFIGDVIAPQNSAPWSARAA
jgi:hypothetical protein